MATTNIKNYNVTPYYDDFDETKGFHRILFKPGVSVQARELTQMQTLLQAQIDRFGKYAFKEGDSVINGEVSLDVERDYIKVEPSFTHSSTTHTTTAALLTSLVGSTLTGQTNAVTATVVGVEATEGSNAHTIYLKYTGSGTGNTFKSFVAGEVLQSNASGTPFVKVGGGSGGASIAATNPVGQNAVFNLKEGVYFLKGNFVFVPGGSITLDNAGDKYSNTPNNIVGLQVTESTVSSAEDTSLVDNALGAPNFSAPGADRYAITTTLVKSASVTSIAVSNFVILAEINNGIMKVDKTDNPDVPLDRRLAKRTFEESGDYAVQPYQLNIKEHLDDEAGNNGHLTSSNGGSATKVAVHVEPNTAYVKGFRVEHTTTELDLNLDKPRSTATGDEDFNTITGYTQTLNIGNYVKLKSSACTGVPNIDNFESINLHSATGGGGSVVGTARARGMEVVGSDIRLYLFDIVMSSGAFGSVRSLKQGTTTFQADFATGAEGVLFETNANTAIVPLPYRAIRSSDAAATFSVRVRQSSSTNGNSITVPSGLTAINEGTVVAQKVNVSSGAFTGNVQNYSASISGSTITFGESAGSGNRFDVIYTATLANQSTKSKQSTTVTDLSVTLSGGRASLAKADVYEITDIRTAASGGGVSIKEQFNLDTGQRDNFYAPGAIVLKPGITAPTNAIFVTFKYFTHNTGNYFSAESYPDYDNIPEFNSPVLGKVKLRDVIDFRPRMNDAGTGFTGTGAVVPSNGFPADSTTFGATIEHWMPRTDTLFIDKNGEYGIVTGVTDPVSPVAPKAPDDSMAIAHLQVAPYVFKVDEDIHPVLIDNKRYTMRDIGRLDRRLKNVEYFTSLSLLEQSAADIQLGVGANERLKNGFIVDNFHGSRIADSSNPEYSVAMDRKRGVLRPQSINRNVNLIRKTNDAVANSSTHNLAVKSSSLVHLPFSETNFVNQPFSSEFINVNPYNIFTWTGVCKLSPESDEWKETNVAPTVYIDDTADFEQFKQMAEQEGILGTVWNEWETTWVGVFTEEERIDQWSDGQGGGGFTDQTTTITTTEQTRSGYNTELSFDTVTRSDGTKVITANWIPFIRSREINFKAQLLKPNTKFYAFFDGTDVSNFVREETFSNSNPFEFSDNSSVKDHGGETVHHEGAGALVSDSQGVINGSFVIPRNDVLKFSTGVREFRLSDDSSNRRNVETSSAEAQYHAQGLLETLQETIISTKVPVLVHSELSESRTITETEVETETTTWEDPLAQTILIDRKGGMFASSVECFFRSKDANIPVRLTIRTTQNGYPTQKIVPGADVILYPSSVNLASDLSVNNGIGNADTATKFSFEHPVYLAPDVEYAIVLTSACDNYEVYIANMGGSDLTDNTKRISKQPYNGVFFTSQNASTWTAEQYKDLKFKLNRCEFDIAKKGEINLVNDVLPTRKINVSSIGTTSGQKTFTVFAKNHGMYVANSKVTISGASAAVNGIPASEIGTTSSPVTHNITSFTHDSFVCENASGSTNATSTGIGGNYGIEITQNFMMDVVYPMIENIQVPGTKINMYMKPTGGRSASGSETTHTLDSSEIRVLPNRNFTFSRPRMVASSANEAGPMSGDKSMQIRLELESTDAGLSPIIDMNRTSLFAIQNRINSENGSEAVIKNGPNVSKYFTKVINLDEPADTLDVFISAKQPSGTLIELYYRVCDSDEDIEQVAFVKDDPEKAIPTGKVFKEAHYLVDKAGDNFAKVQFKIVLKSTSSAIIPEVKDLRAICST
jgi:hypothetical protein